LMCLQTPLPLLIFFVWVRLPASGQCECPSGVAFGFSFLPPSQRLTDSLKWPERHKKYLLWKALEKNSEEGGVNLALHESIDLYLKVQINIEKKNQIGDFNVYVY